jgi:dihydrofolate synthase / folylpolyglutamate synthase
MDFSAALRDLDTRQPESMPEPTLDRISQLVKLLDHPELTYPTIHITGTNGKTTTARLVTALACAHGLTTGTFISPHLESVTERLAICGRRISDDDFAEEYGHLAPFFDRVDGLGPRVTYFEALTALAYLWFADKPIGLGVFEVGMGGTWDATNLVRGDVAVICPIGLDHRELGSTVAEVASEKAGIIKQGRSAVVREQRPEAMDVLHGRARDVGASLLLEGDAFELTARTQALGGQALSIRGLFGTYEAILLPLWGEQAARNAAASIAATEALLGRALDDATVRRTLGEARSPGRIEVVARRPLVVLDGAHNPDAAAALARALPEGFQWGQLHLVLAMFGDKDVESVAALLGPLADRAWAAQSASPRAAPTERVAAALRAAGVAEVESAGSVREAAVAARDAAGRADLVLVTGSFYTVGDARPLFTGAAPSPDSDRRDVP